jgi:hypothetical protein
MKTSPGSTAKRSSRGLRNARPITPGTDTATVDRVRPSRVATCHDDVADDRRLCRPGVSVEQNGSSHRASPSTERPVRFRERFDESLLEGASKGVYAAIRRVCGFRTMAESVGQEHEQSLTIETKNGRDVSGDDFSGHRRHGGTCVEHQRGTAPPRSMPVSAIFAQRDRGASAGRGLDFELVHEALRSL